MQNIFFTMFQDRHQYPDMSEYNRSQSTSCLRTPVADSRFSSVTALESSRQRWKTDKKSFCIVPPVTEHLQRKWNHRKESFSCHSASTTLNLTFEFWTICEESENVLEMKRKRKQENISLFLPRQNANPYTAHVLMWKSAPRPPFCRQLLCHYALRAH